MKRRGILAVSLCAETVCWLRAGEMAKRRRLAVGAAGAGAAALGTEPAKILIDLPESGTADVRASIGSSADSILHILR